MTQQNEQVVDALKTVFDPEIPVNIYDLGLIYEIEQPRENEIAIKMTLTSPACPVAQTLPNEVKQTVRNATGVDEVNVDVVWDPPWTQDAMSDEAKLALNLM